MHKHSYRVLFFLCALIFSIVSCVDYKGNDVVPPLLRSIEAHNMNLNIKADSSFTINLGDMVEASESFTVQIRPFEAGSFKLLNDTLLQYVPKEGFVGTDSTTLTACLVGMPSNCATASIKFTVKAKVAPCQGKANPDTIVFRYGETKIENLAENDVLCANKSYHIRLQNYVEEYCRWSNGSATAFIFQPSMDLMNSRELVVPYELYEDNIKVDSSYVVLKLEGRQEHCSSIYNLVKDEFNAPRQRVLRLHLNEILANDISCPNDLDKSRFRMSLFSEHQTIRTQIHGDSLYFFANFAQGTMPAPDTVYYSIPSVSAGFAPNRVKRAPIIIRFN